MQGCALSVLEPWKPNCITAGIVSHNTASSRVHFASLFIVRPVQFTEQLILADIPNVQTLKADTENVHILNVQSQYAPILMHSSLIAFNCLK